MVSMTSMGKNRNSYKFWSQNLKGRSHLEDPGEDGRIILKWISAFAVIDPIKLSFWLLL
jgi:hypothetical protein